MKSCFARPGHGDLLAEVSAKLPETLSLDFNGARLAVSATSARPLANLRRVYRHFLSARTAAPDARLVLLEAGSEATLSIADAHGHVARDMDTHLLLADWFDWGLRIANHALLHYYASKLTRLWVVERWDADAVTLHAASLSDGTGGGMLLIGEAAAGKTTLTNSLLQRGFRYCSDDTSCIARRDALCVPFPMAMISRSAGSYGQKPDLQLLDEPRWLIERWDAVGVPFRPRALYFLSRGTAGPVVQPLQPAEAALMLLRNLVMPIGADAELFAAEPANFDLACRLADGARCANVMNFDPDRTLRAVLDDYQGAVLQERLTA